MKHYLFVLLVLLGGSGLAISQVVGIAKSKVPGNGRVAVEPAADIGESAPVSLRIRWIHGYTCINAFYAPQVGEQYQ